MNRTYKEELVSNELSIEIESRNHELDFLIKEITANEFSNENQIYLTNRINQLEEKLSRVLSTLNNLKKTNKKCLIQPPSPEVIRDS